MPLPLSPAVEAVVRGGVRALGEGCAARAGLSRAAQLVELSAMMEIARRVAVHKSAALTIKNSQKTFLVTNHLSASLLLRPKTSQ